MHKNSTVVKNISQLWSWHWDKWEASVTLTHRRRGDHSVRAGCRWCVGGDAAGCAGRIGTAVQGWRPAWRLWRNKPWGGSEYRWTQSPPAPLWVKVEKLQRHIQTITNTISCKVTALILVEYKVSLRQESEQLMDRRNVIRCFHEAGIYCRTRYFLRNLCAFTPQKAGSEFSSGIVFHPQKSKQVWTWDLLDGGCSTATLIGGVFFVLW